jgi:hypothetical protein
MMQCQQKDSDYREMADGVVKTGNTATRGNVGDGMPTYLMILELKW